MQIENLRRLSIADIESDLAPDETADDFRARAREAAPESSPPAPREAAPP